MNWYYAESNDNQIGPIDESEMLSLISAGTIKRGTLVWNESLSDWVALEDSILKDHLPKLPPSPPPISSAAPITDSFEREDDKVYPTNPPKSPHLSWLNLLGPGLAQVIFGKMWMGVALIIAFNFVTSLYASGSMSDGQYTIIWLLLLGGTITDGYMSANQLQKGKPIGKWRIFPRDAAQP